MGYENEAIGVVLKRLERGVKSVDTWKMVRLTWQCVAEHFAEVPRVSVFKWDGRKAVVTALLARWKRRWNHWIPAVGPPPLTGVFFGTGRVWGCTVAGFLERAALLGDTSRSAEIDVSRRCVDCGPRVKSSSLVGATVCEDLQEWLSCVRCGGRWLATVLCASPVAGEAACSPRPR